MIMKQYLLTATLLTLAASASAQIAVEGSRHVAITPPAATGLKNIYVVENLASARFVYTASSPSVRVQRYGNMGGGYAEDVAGVTRVPGTDSYVIPVAPAPEGAGFIVNDGPSQFCFWVTDYAASPYAITSLAPGEQDCDRITLYVTGSAPEMHYYTVNGRRENIDREIPLEYTTLAYDADSRSYVETRAVESLASASAAVHAPAPLCDTGFTIGPDRFASAWGLASGVTSTSVTAVAVNAETYAEQTPRDADNEQKPDTEGLGGSAPCEITFGAAVTDAAIYRRWEVATTPDFVDTFLTFDQLDFTYTFNDAGTFYVRFTANNAAGSCEYQGDTYTVAIGESRLECPNAFSPGTSEGVNDEWKVSYRSIVSFDCQIFNRWGQRMATLTDPSQGWDGKHGGKYVTSGVYFYVIKARGSDGKEYKLSGDINVISSRRNPNGTGTTAPQQ